mmetsp:Transcript_33599/g.42891  ORF Transcript_33599/g.42891 Transcript_33599/m.42891 type:complete len:330 (-) Transcript_33599:86-1075(-)
MNRAYDLDLDHVLESDDGMQALRGGNESDDESDDDLPGLVRGDDSDEDSTDDDLPGLVDVDEASSSDETSEDEVPQVEMLQQSLFSETRAGQNSNRANRAFTQQSSQSRDSGWGSTLNRGFLEGRSNRRANAPPPPPAAAAAAAQAQSQPEPLVAEAEQKASSETQEDGGWRKRKRDKQKKKKKKKKAQQQNNNAQAKKKEEGKIESKQVPEAKPELPKKIFQIEEMLDVLPAILIKGFAMYTEEKLHEIEIRLDRSIADVKKAKVSMERKKKKYEDDNNACIICMDAPKSTLLMPCRHICVCDECSDSVNQCPMCRDDIVTRIKNISI